MLDLARRVRKIAKRNSFVMSIYPSVRMEEFGFHWTDFDET
jgi:hypothetical protein